MDDTENLWDASTPYASFPVKASIISRVSAANSCTGFQKQNTPYLSIYLFSGLQCRLKRPPRKTTNIATTALYYNRRPRIVFSSLVVTTHWSLFPFFNSLEILSASFWIHAIDPIRTLHSFYMESVLLQWFTWHYSWRKMRRSSSVSSLLTERSSIESFAASNLFGALYSLNIHFRFCTVTDDLSSFGTVANAISDSALHIIYNGCWRKFTYSSRMGT